MRRIFHILISVTISLGLLWLALMQVDHQEFLAQLSEVSMGWTVPFLFALVLSHYLRAERWRLLLERDHLPSRTTLFAGVMIGYMANYILPRLGEISRPLYVGRRQGSGSGKLFGTIVLERVIDLIALGILLAVLAWAFSRDPGLFDRLLGSEDRAKLILVLIPVVILSGAFLFGWLVRLLKRNRNRTERFHPLLEKGSGFLIHLWDGFVAIRHLKQWPLFLVYTVGIWFGYAVMTYLPFHMLDLHSTFQLGLREAAVITIFSAVGVAIPTPGGAGSYHLLVQQGLWYLYSVPLSAALTYATVTHAVTFLFVVSIGGISLWIDKYWTLRREGER
ncbi:MAG: lysylphosphatidylglycerol synthase transmembrane domain-containing protein [Balneolaceae bacterium]